MMGDLGVRKVFTDNKSCNLEYTMEGFQKLGRVSDRVRLNNVQLYIGNMFPGYRARPRISEHLMVSDAQR